MLAMLNDWRGLLDSAMGAEEARDLRGHGRTGLLLGDATCLERLEKLVGRVVRRRKPGRKPKLSKPPN